jgi:integrase
MAAKMVKTATPGIFKRGSRYVFSYRVDGKQRWESARTLNAARKARDARVTDVDRGEHHAVSKVTLHAYAAEWIEGYVGRRRGGFRVATRDEYRRQLQQYVYACPSFPAKLRLTEVTPKRVSDFVKWLMDEKAQGKRVADERYRLAVERQAQDEGLPVPVREKDPAPVVLSDATIRNIMAPLRACLATARKEGEIRSNPASETDLPYRPTVESDEDEVKAMSRDELACVLELIDARHRVLFEVLAATGLRISEAVALQWQHLHLDGSAPQLRVRRAFVRGVMGPPKSKHGKRSIPLAHELVLALREHRKGSEWPGEKDLVFPSLDGTPLDMSNLRRRALNPAAQEADVSWIGFHTFRHTCASMLFADGRNAVQVQRWLGHHSPAFTLKVYVHLLDEDIGEALSLPVRGANKVQTCPTPSGDTRPSGIECDSGSQSQVPGSTPLHATAGSAF